MLGRWLLGVDWRTINPITGGALEVPVALWGGVGGGEMLSLPEAREGFVSCFPALHEGQCEVTPHPPPLPIHTVLNLEARQVPAQPKGTICSLELYSDLHSTEEKKSKIKCKPIFNN